MISAPLLTFVLLYSRSQASLSASSSSSCEEAAATAPYSDAALDALFARHAMLSSVAYKEGFGARGLPVVRLRGDRAPLTAAIEVYRSEVRLSRDRGAPPSCRRRQNFTKSSSPLLHCLRQSMPAASSFCHSGHGGLGALKTRR